MNIVVAGCGSLGSHLVSKLVQKDTIKRILVYDPDIVSSQNLSKSIYRKEDIGKSKALVLQELFPEKVTGIATKIPPTEKFSNFALVLDVTDEVSFTSNFATLKAFLCDDSIFVVFPKSEDAFPLVFREKREACRSKYTKENFNFAAQFLSYLIIDVQIYKAKEAGGIHKFPIKLRRDKPPFKVLSPRRPIAIREEETNYFVRYKGFTLSFEKETLEETPLEEIIMIFYKTFPQLEDLEKDCIETISKRPFYIYPHYVKTKQKTSLVYEIIDLEVLA